MSNTKNGCRRTGGEGQADGVWKPIADEVAANADVAEMQDLTRHTNLVAIDSPKESALIRDITSENR